MKKWLPRAFLSTAAWLVPSAMRQEWLAEWRAELAHVCHARHAARDALAFASGAFRDALWLLRNKPREENSGSFLDSPASSIAVLSILAVSLWMLAQPWMQSLGPANWNRMVVIFPLMAALSFLLLPATTRLSLGEYPVNRYSPPPAVRLRRWLFLLLKLALVLCIVFFGTIALLALPVAALRPHAIVPGCILAFRWVLNDQRRRCPVCLRRLRHPTSIGCSGQTFLEWHGTELACPKGHGLLHVSEYPSSSYTGQRWLYLDPSWTCLFRTGRG